MSGLWLSIFGACWVLGAGNAWSSSDSGYAVTATLFTHGTYKVLTHELKAGRVRVTRHSTNGAPDRVVLDRALTSAQKTDLDSFMRAFPLRGLRKRYVDPKVEGEHHLEFDIRVGKTRRRVLVYFVKEPSLWRLAKRINDLVPPELATYYGRDGVDD